MRLSPVQWITLFALIFTVIVTLIRIKSNKLTFRGELWALTWVIHAAAFYVFLGMRHAGLVECSNIFVNNWSGIVRLHIVLSLSGRAIFIKEALHV